MVSAVAKPRSGRRVAQNEMWDLGPDSFERLFQSRTVREQGKGTSPLPAIKRCLDPACTNQKREEVPGHAFKPFQSFP